MLADVECGFDGVGVHANRLVIVGDAFVNELLLEVHVLFAGDGRRDQNCFKLLRKLYSANHKLISRSMIQI